MKTFSRHTTLFRCFTCFAFPILFLSAAALHAANVTISSGSMESTLSGGTSLPQGGMNLQGPNFSLTSPVQIEFPDLLQSSLNISANTITFNPTQSFLLQQAFVTLTYNGVTYTDCTLAVSLVGASTTVSDNPAPVGNYMGTVSNLPFSMSGTVTAYSGTGTVLLQLAISGSGLYSAGLQGNYLAEGPGGNPSGNAFYSFTSGPNALQSGTDTSTQGSWNGKYGGDGYLIPNGASQTPSYASVAFPDVSTYTWAGVTADPRALQNGAGSTVGIASTYIPANYGNTFTVNVNLTDGNIHHVAFYLLDWDTSNQRVETITIADATTGAVLSTENFSSFSSGEYAIWNLQGNLNITFTPTGYPGPVLSGIFFGPPGVPSVPAPSLSSATFLGGDGATQGHWTGTYGLAGYMIANDVVSLPTYATANVTGDFTYTWAAQTTDPRALQTHPGSATGIASAYTQYSAGSFKINIDISDGNSHPISFYFLDWDDELRAENITITDASTGAVLSSLGFANTVSSEANPPYLNYQIKGNVVVTVTSTNASSPAISGIFFN